jgi:hypothetical protein
MGVFGKHGRIFLFSLSLYFLTACSQNQPTNQVITSQCPTQPTAVLETNNVKPISLSSQAITETGMVTNNKSLGYTFTAKSGDKLVYKTNQDICIWIYTPDNQLITNPILPLDGKYTVQLAAIKGSTTFDLAINLENVNDISIASNTPQVSSSPSQQAEVDSTTTSDLSVNESQPTPSVSDNVSSSQTPTPENSNNVDRPSPGTAIKDYYIQINNKQYQTAWDIYPIAVKENKELHPDGYNSFIEWWDKVDYVNIDKVSVEEEIYDNAIVNISTRYKMKSGKVSPVKLNFYLNWNKENQRWYVTKIQHE